MDVAIQAVATGASRVAVDPALYVPSRTQFLVGNICENVVGVPIGAGAILLFLQYDARPFFDESALALVNLSTGRVLDVRTDIGAIKFNSLVLRKDGEQEIDVRVVREKLTNHGCDCAEMYIEDWLRISARSEKIHTEWLRQ